MTNSTPFNRFHLKRRGVLLTPDSFDPREAGGVLNPAIAALEGRRYLLYRAVALEPKNYSRILVAEVTEKNGTYHANRLNHVALEPQADYELWGDGKGGGVEDPRITQIGNEYIMTYVAYGTVKDAHTPRVALASSTDLLNWQRMGLVHYDPVRYDMLGHTYFFDMDVISNKDAVIFPEKINGRYAMLHRPMFPYMAGIPQGIWLSYSDDLLSWYDHQVIMDPRPGWECAKIGAGSQPILLDEGWLVFYHGVNSIETDPDLRYRVGAILLDKTDPSRVLYRSAEPVLSPESEQERIGVVNNVVFPCGALVNSALQIEVYYGMGDAAIGIATTALP